MNGLQPLGQHALDETSECAHSRIARKVSAMHAVAQGLARS